MKQKILIIGGSGALGQLLKKKLSAEFEVAISSRNCSRREWCFEWDGTNATKLKEILSHFDGVINLAGLNIGSRIWSKKNKQSFYNSRIQTTKALHQAALERPNLKFIIQGSAIAYYGNTNNLVSEESQAGKGFLSNLCQDWENAIKADDLPIPVAILRTANVLHPDFGFLQKVMPLYRYSLGAVPAKGNQPFSWIHAEDWLNAVHFIIQNQLHGAFNLCAPNAISYNDFHRSLSKIIGRKNPWRIPKFLLQLLPGKMGTELFLNGQQAEPQQLLQKAFTFKYPEINTALQQLVISLIS